MKTMSLFHLQSGGEQLLPQILIVWVIHCTVCQLLKKKVTGIVRLDCSFILSN